MKVKKSDRSAKDRLRHRQKIREAIKENIADIISDEAIIGKSKEKIIKIPLQGIKEYKFIYGDNAPGVGQAEGEVKEGDIIKKGEKEVGKGDKAGNLPGEDYYETDITLEEIIDIMFEDLALPRLQRKKFQEILGERKTKRKGYRRKGIRVRLDKRKTAVRRIKRRLASHFDEKYQEEERRFPYREDDLKYRHMEEDIKKQSNAVVICIMDTSGSMGVTKKYLARSFYFLLYQFIKTRYQNVEIVFVAHHTQAKEVNEEEFFHKGESGGTFISSGYKKALEIIENRYHPSIWNIYAFHCSDGDNFESDNKATLEAAKKLIEVSNLFGYGEIKPKDEYSFFSGSMIDVFKPIKTDNFVTLRIEKKEDLWKAFREFLSHEGVE